MTLREMIERCESLAESCEGSLCGDQHKQLAEWLKDYERLKELLPCLALDKDDYAIIAERLCPLPPLACEGNSNGWTMFDEGDMDTRPPIYEDVLVQYWDDTYGIDSFTELGRWCYENKPIACWRALS